METSYFRHSEKKKNNNNKNTLFIMKIVKVQQSQDLQPQKFDFPDFAEIETSIENESKGLLTLWQSTGVHTNYCHMNYLGF